MAGYDPATDAVLNGPLLRGGRGVGDPLVRVTLDRLDVFALDADQPRRAVAARRMQIALVVDISVARSERVVAHRAGLSRPIGARPREALVLGHDRLAKRLTVDRPGRAVIVRLAFLGTLIDMAENAEAELGILVENLPLRPALGQVLTDELRIGARLLDESADLFAALGSGLGGEDAVTIGRELFECIGHRLILLRLDRQAKCRPASLCRHRTMYKA